MRFPRLPLPSSRRKRLILFILIPALALGAAAGGLYARHRHQVYLAGPRYALDQLNESLRRKDAAIFARIVDVPALAASFTGIATELGAMDGPGAIPAAAGSFPDHIQNFLHTLARAEPLPKLEVYGIPALPDDFYEQLQQTPFTLLAVLDDRAVAESVIRHPALGDHTSLRLELSRRGDRWLITAVANLKTLLADYSRLTREAARRQQEEMRLEQARQIRLMAEFLPDLACTGGVTAISGGTPLLLLGLKSGSYSGQETINSWEITLSLRNEQGEEIAAPNIRQNAPLPAGAGIDGVWHQEIDAAEYRRLLAAGPLRCLPEREYIIFSSGRILQARPQDQPPP